MVSARRTTASPGSRPALPLQRVGRHAVRLELDWGAGTLENVYEVPVE